MQAISLATVAILTAASAWQNNFYAFMFGCAALVTTAVLFSADRIVGEIRLSRRVESLTSERIGAQVATAINASAMTYRKRGA